MGTSTVKVQSFIHWTNVDRARDPTMDPSPCLSGADILKPGRDIIKQMKMHCSRRK